MEPGAKGQTNGMAVAIAGLQQTPDKHDRLDRAVYGRSVVGDRLAGDADSRICLTIGQFRTRLPGCNGYSTS